MIQNEKEVLLSVKLNLVLYGFALLFCLLDLLTGQKRKSKLNRVGIFKIITLKMLLNHLNAEYLNP